MSSSSKSRQPRLRASCDGCFLAKVKCSKARPICSRCLACGIECRYSPSSRSGKSKSEGSSHSPAEMAMSPLDEEMYSSGMYKYETGGWQTPPTGMDPSMSRNASISSSLALMGLPEQGSGDDPSGMYGGVPWTPPNDYSSGSYGEMSMSGMGSMSSGWPESAGSDMLAYNATNSIPTPPSMGSSFFPSPSATPNMRPAVRHKSSSSRSGGSSRSKGSSSNSSSSSCTCFSVCLQSLQALHNASSPASPPFDLVLTLNRKAVEGCAAMLACSRCMSRSGTHTAAMLLATVIGKITSFYHNASQEYFESGGSAMPVADPNSGSSLGVSLGAYTLGGEDGRWLELEILARELRKLEDVYAQFREVCADLSEDPEVSRAMIGYLGNNLGNTLAVVSHRKGDMGYS